MPKLKRGELAQVIADLIDSSKDEKKLAKSIATYLVEEKQSADLDSLLRSVMSIRQKRGTIEVSATTAYALTPQVEKDVKALVARAYSKTDKVIVYSDVEPTVLSGVRLQTVDKQLDATARGKLDQLRRAVA